MKLSIQKTGDLIHVSLDTNKPGIRTHVKPIEITLSNEQAGAIVGVLQMAMRSESVSLSLDVKE